MSEPQYFGVVGPVSDHDHTKHLDGTWRPDWDDYFLGIAWAVARRADCRRRQIGAVIVDKDRRIVSTGYNGAPSGEGSCLAGDCPRGRFTRDEVASFTEGNQDFSECISLHCEQNAIAWGDRSRMEGATLYLAQLDRVPVPSCDMCAKLVKAAGITRTVTD